MRFSAEHIQQLRDRWHKPLLDSQGEPTVVEDCRSFQQLLTKRLQAIGVLLNPKIEKVDKALNSEERRKRYQAIWSEVASHRFKRLMDDLTFYSLEFRRETPQLEVDLRGADCRDALFYGMDASSADFDGADCAFAHFEGAFCWDGHFDGADCRGANFDGANLMNAHYENANCSFATFDHVNCSQTSFEDTRLYMSTFQNVNADGAHFNGAFLEGATLNLKISGDTDFGVPGEQVRAEKDNLQKSWRTASDANLRIKHCWKSNGFYQEASDYYYQEMVCRRHAYSKKSEQYADLIFFDWVAGYGLKWWRPFRTGIFVLLLWSVFFAVEFRIADLYPGDEVRMGINYSVSSFLTIVQISDKVALSSFWFPFFVYTESTLGIVLLSLFLVAYARRILQD